MNEQNVEAKVEKWYAYAKARPYFVVALLSFVGGIVATLVVQHL